MEANFIASGISYRAKTEKTPETYNHLRWVRIWAFETMQHPMDATGNWNIGSHLWLKYYIMLRWIDRKLPRGRMSHFADSRFIKKSISGDALSLGMHEPIDLHAWC